LLISGAVSCLKTLFILCLKEDEGLVGWHTGLLHENIAKKEIGGEEVSYVINNNCMSN